MQFKFGKYREHFIKDVNDNYLQWYVDNVDSDSEQYPQNKMFVEMIIRELDRRINENDHKKFDALYKEFK